MSYGKVILTHIVLGWARVHRGLRAAGHAVAETALAVISKARSATPSVTDRTPDTAAHGADHPEEDTPERNCD